MLRIQIKEFSGPLDLLLQLIRREEMDIFDIDIHKITEQYLTFIEQNPIIKDLDSAGDFIRMSALLIYIKSKSLFPSECQESAEPETDEEDLEKALTFRLLKMRIVQSVSQQFNEYSLLKRDVWPSATEDAKELSSLFSSVSAPRIKQEPLLKLLRAYRRVFDKDLSSKKGHSSLFFQEPFPVLSDCIRVIHHRLRVGAKMKMSALAQEGEGDSLSQTTLVTFLTLLELSRLGVVSLEQDKDFADIAIFVRRQFKDKDFYSIQELVGPE